MVARRQSLGTVEPRLGGIRIQTSAYGLAIPKVYGLCRVPGNLLWYGGFRAIPQEERAETGKGGSPPSRVYYVYSADVMMALGEGPITEVRRVWKGKQQFDGAPATVAKRNRQHLATVPSNGQITVALDGAAFVSDLRVSIVAFDDNGDHYLTAGVHYSVAAGAYTLDTASHSWMIGKQARLDYIVEESATARDALEELGLVLSPGTYSQSMWPHLMQSKPSEALAYPGIAYVRGRDYPLSSAAEIENHNFEVAGALQYSASIPDCVPAEVVYDILTNERSGVQMPGDVIGSLASWTAYTNAHRIWISFAASDQRPARTVIGEILDATNTDPCWDGQQLRFLPRGDENIGGYVAPNTPVMEIGPDQLASRIKVTRKSQSEVKSSTRVEYSDRDNGYNLEIVEYRDEATEIDHGKRQGQPHAWHFLTNGNMAMRAAMLRGQRESAARNTYAFSLPGAWIEIQPGDLVLLNDPAAKIVGVIARITRIAESGSDSLQVEAEDFPIAHANAPEIDPEIGAGFQMNQNADPGVVTAPIFIEPPGGFTETGLEVWIAVAGQNEMWGGCDVYCSLDGESYKQLGTIEQSARCGRVRAASAAGAVGPMRIQQHGRAPVLRSFSAADADALRSLCYVGDPDSGEYMAYEAGRLVGAGQYDLYGLRRGRYTTTDQAHAANEPFVVVDGALGTSGALDRELIGKKVWFKFPSHNVFGGGVQSLATVPAYEYTVRGRFVGLKDRPSPANLLPNAGFEFDASGYNTFRYHADPQTFQKAAGGSAIKGVPSNAILRQSGTALPGQPAGGTNSDMISCQAGIRYGVAALLRSVNCQSRVALAFFDANGVQIAGTQVYSAQTTDHSTESIDPAAHELRAAYRDAPPGARTMLIQYGKTGTRSGASSSSVSVFQPRVFEVIGADQVPPWSPGPNGIVGTPQLGDKVATEIIAPTNIADLVGQTVTGVAPIATRELVRFTPTISGDVEVIVEARAMIDGTGTNAQLLTAGLSVNGAPAEYVDVQWAPPPAGGGTGPVQASGLMTLTGTYQVTAGVEFVVSVRMFVRDFAMTIGAIVPIGGSFNGSYALRRIRPRVAHIKR